MEENSEKICVLCSNKGADINLQLIPIQLPNYLPKNGFSHLDCLDEETNKHIPYLKMSTMNFLFCLILSSGLVISISLLFITSAFWVFALGLVLTFIIMLAIWLPDLFTKSNKLMRWIKKEFKSSENSEEG